MSRASIRETKKCCETAGTSKQTTAQRKVAHECCTCLVQPSHPVTSLLARYMREKSAGYAPNGRLLQAFSA